MPAGKSTHSETCYYKIESDKNEASALEAVMARSRLWYFWMDNMDSVSNANARSGDRRINVSKNETKLVTVTVVKMRCDAKAATVTVVAVGAGGRSVSSAGEK